jgi:hypothetical protein
MAKKTKTAKVAGFHTDKFSVRATRKPFTFGKVERTETVATEAWVPDYEKAFPSPPTFNRHVTREVTEKELKPLIWVVAELSGKGRLFLVDNALREMVDRKRMDANIAFGLIRHYINQGWLAETDIAQHWLLQATPALRKAYENRRKPGGKTAKKTAAPKKAVKKKKAAKKAKR